MQSTNKCRRETPNRARIQPETCLRVRYVNHAVTSQRAGRVRSPLFAGSSAKSLWCLILSASPEIRAIFQRDSSRRHAEVRVLPPQPTSNLLRAWLFLSFWRCRFCRHLARVFCVCASSICGRDEVRAISRRERRRKSLRRHFVVYFFVAVECAMPRPKRDRS
jgi:hypothetical protein